MTKENFKVKIRLDKDESEDDKYRKLFEIFQLLLADTKIGNKKGLKDKTKQANNLLLSAMPTKTKALKSTMFHESINESDRFLSN